MAAATGGATIETTTEPPATGGVPATSPLPECVICFAPYDRLFKVPKALGCGHCFCLECLARVTAAAGTPPDPPALPCPLCRRPTPLPPRRGPPALPTPPDLLAVLPPGPSGSVRFSRPKGLLYVPPGRLDPPGQVPTVTLSLEVGPPEPPRSRAGPRGCWPLARVAAVTLALLLGGALAFGGVFLIFLKPLACGEGGPVANSTAGQQGWPPC